MNRILWRVLFEFIGTLVLIFCHIVAAFSQWQTRESINLDQSWCILYGYKKCAIFRNLSPNARPNKLAHTSDFAIKVWNFANINKAGANWLIEKFMEKYLL